MDPNAQANMNAKIKSIQEKYETDCKEKTRKIEEYSLLISKYLHPLTLHPLTNADLEQINEYIKKLPDRECDASYDGLSTGSYRLLLSNLKWGVGEAQKKMAQSANAAPKGGRRRRTKRSKKSTRRTRRQKK